MHYGDYEASRWSNSSSGSTGGGIKDPVCVLATFHLYLPDDCVRMEIGDAFQLCFEGFEVELARRTLCSTPASVGFFARPVI